VLCLIAARVRASPRDSEHQRRSWSSPPRSHVPQKPAGTTNAVPVPEARGARRWRLSMVTRPRGHHAQTRSRFVTHAPFARGSPTSDRQRTRMVVGEEIAHCKLGVPAIRRRPAGRTPQPRPSVQGTDDSAPRRAARYSCGKSSATRAAGPPSHGGWMLARHAPGPAGNLIRSGG